MNPFTLRQRIGAIIYDAPRLAWTLRPAWRGPGSHWIDMRNRDEQLTRDESGLGRRCLWEWTSALHVARVYPVAGHALMRRALASWPIACAECPAATHPRPTATFIIGHRGVSRLPHLLMTLRSIAGQSRTDFECIVVEQGAHDEIRSALPPWVRYVADSVPPDAPYSRARAFNVGAAKARGRLLVLHDNDMLVPQHYLREVAARHDAGFEIINLKRFVFYMTRQHTARVFTEGWRPDRGQPPELIIQNLEAGGSVAVDRATYDALGGFDESFVGWGGEDNEFWNRALTRRVWPYAYLPIVHLWHAPQAEKAEVRPSPGEIRYATLRQIDAHDRIRRLVNGARPA